MALEEARLGRLVGVEVLAEVQGLRERATGLSRARRRATRGDAGRGTRSIHGTISVISSKSFAVHFDRSWWHTLLMNVVPDFGNVATITSLARGAKRRPDR